MAIGHQAYLKITQKIDIHTLMNGDGGIDYANEKPWDYRKYKIVDSIKSDVSRLLHLNNKQRPLEFYFANKLQELGITAEICSVDHHLAHALSAYHFSGKDNCLIITADGFGDGLSGGVYQGKNGRVTRLHSTSDLHSLGASTQARLNSWGIKGTGMKENLQGWRHTATRKN